MSLNCLKYLKKHSGENTCPVYSERLPLNKTKTKQQLELIKAHYFTP